MDQILTKIMETFAGKIPDDIKTPGHKIMFLSLTGQLYLQVALHLL